jgi:hypothetical protein
MICGVALEARLDFAGREIVLDVMIHFLSEKSLPLPRQKGKGQALGITVLR